MSTQPVPVLGALAPRAKGENDFEIVRFFPLQLLTPADMGRKVEGEVSIVLPALGMQRQYACVIIVQPGTPLREVERAIRLAERELYGLHQTFKRHHERHEESPFDEFLSN